jgi:hypothetical protein
MWKWSMLACSSTSCHSRSRTCHCSRLATKPGRDHGFLTVRVAAVIEIGCIFGHELSRF